MVAVVAFQRGLGVAELGVVEAELVGHEYASGGVAAAQCLGIGLALAAALLPLALCAEVRAGGRAASEHWLAEQEVGSMLLNASRDTAIISVLAPRAATRMLMGL